MSVLLSWSVSELKNIVRNRMTVFMVFYPFLLGGIGRYLIVNDLVREEALGIIATFMVIIVGFAYGAMAGFSLLDDRDDQVFASIRISPVSLDLYIWFKVGFAYLLALLGGFFVIWYGGALRLSVWDTLLVSALSALQTPITAFLVNAFAHNKVEGFVTMKATGFLLLFPAGGFFFLDALEWLFAIAPPHWAAKAVQRAMLEPMIDAGLVRMNLAFHQYIAAGMVYNLVLVALTYLLFRRKNAL